MSSRKARTRRAILEAARRLIESTASPGVRMADIAREAGVSRQAVYLHFGSRAALLIALAKFVDRKGGLAALAAPVWDANSGAEALRRFAALNADYTPRIYPVARALMSDRRTDEDVAAAWENRMNSRRRACRRLIRWVEKDGDLSPDWTAASAVDALWALTSIQVWEQLVVEGGWSAGRYRKHIARMIEKVLLK